jgi:phage antirepressor YoqD-like protein
MAVDSGSKSELLTLPEIAKLLDVTRECVRQWVLGGRIPSTLIKRDDRGAIHACKRFDVEVFKLKRERLELARRDVRGTL